VRHTTILATRDRAHCCAARSFGSSREGRWCSDDRQACPELVLGRGSTLERRLRRSGRRRCSVTSKTGACLSVLSLVGHDGASGAQTSNVDAFQGTCLVPDPANPGQTMVVGEPFTDHAAIVTIVNAPPLDVAELSAAPAVTLDAFDITYQLNDCPPTRRTPPRSRSARARADLARARTERHHPRQHRDDLHAAARPVAQEVRVPGQVRAESAFPSYTAVYVIRGHDAEGAVALEARSRSRSATSTTAQQSSAAGKGGRMAGQSGHRPRASRGRSPTASSTTVTAARRGERGSFKPARRASRPRSTSPTASSSSGRPSTATSSSTMPRCRDATSPSSTTAWPS